MSTPAFKKEYHTRNRQLFSEKEALMHQAYQTWSKSLETHQYTTSLGWSLFCGEKNPIDLHRITPFYSSMEPKEHREYLINFLQGVSYAGRRHLYEHACSFLDKAALRHSCLFQLSLLNQSHDLWEKIEKKVHEIFLINKGALATLAHSMFLQFKKQYPLDDIYQWGAAHMMEAIHIYESTSDNEFGGLIFFGVSSRIKRHIHEENYVVRFPEERRSRALRMKKGALMCRGEHPTDEMCRQYGITPQEYAIFADPYLQNYIPLDYIKAEDPVDMEEETFVLQRRRHVHESINKLEKDKRCIIYLYFYTENALSDEEKKDYRDYLKSLRLPAKKLAELKTESMELLKELLNPEFLLDFVSSH